jgi:hypothetical protein
MLGMLHRDVRDVRDVKRGCYAKIRLAENSTFDPRKQYIGAENETFEVHSLGVNLVVIGYNFIILHKIDAINVRKLHSFSAENRRKLHFSELTIVRFYTRPGANRTVPLGNIPYRMQKDSVPSECRTQKAQKSRRKAQKAQKGDVDRLTDSILLCVESVGSGSTKIQPVRFS